MSPKRAILTALKGASERHVRPPSIPGYAERPDRYQQAVNELLQARLVEGRKDAEGHLTIALNEHRRQDVERLLRPIWAKPVIWAVAVALLALGAGLAVV
jgi:hypothetical protein